MGVCRGHRLGGNTIQFTGQTKVKSGLAGDESVASPPMLENIVRAFRFLLSGQFRRVWNEVHVRLYRGIWAVLWNGVMPFRRAGRAQPTGTFVCDTKYPVAFASPDHIAPKGTAVNNSTNK